MVEIIIAVTVGSIIRPKKYPVSPWTWTWASIHSIETWKEATHDSSYLMFDSIRIISFNNSECTLYVWRSRDLLIWNYLKYGCWYQQRKQNIISIDRKWRVHWVKLWHQGKGREGENYIEWLCVSLFLFKRNKTFITVLSRTPANNRPQPQPHRSSGYWPGQETVAKHKTVWCWRQWATNVVWLGNIGIKSVGTNVSQASVVNTSAELSGGEQIWLIAF